jgi:hypothetical protein
LVLVTFSAFSGAVGFADFFAAGVASSSSSSYVLNVQFV